MDVGLVIDIAKVIKLKYDSIKALHKECSKAFEVATTVIEVATKLKSELRKRRHNAPGIMGPIESLKEGVNEINKIMDVCCDEPVKANLFSKMYLSKLRAATAKIKDAMSLLGNAKAGISLEIQRELHDVTEVLALIQDLPNEIADEVRLVIRSEMKDIVQCLLENGVVTDTEDAKMQLEQLQAEKDDVLSEKLLVERDILERVCALSIAELETTAPQRPEVPESFRCPLSLELMEDPVYLTTCGRSFERTWLEHAFQVHPYQDPITGLCYDHKLTFGPNRSLKDAIEEWKQKHHYAEPVGSVSINQPIIPARPPERLLSKYDWLRKIYNNDPALTKLDLCSNEIESEGAKAIATALATNTSLQTLDLSSLNIGTEVAEVIATALKRNNSLHTRGLR